MTNHGGQSKFIPSLDGLRAISVLIVFWGHAERVPHVLQASVGVTIFFFISGYLITTLLRMEYERHGRISIKNFYLRRVFRIFPPLYASIVLGLILTASGLVAATMNWGGLVSAILQVTNWRLIVEGDNAGVPTAMRVLWSLAVEEHFYLVFPLLYVGLIKWLPNNRSRGTALIAICLAVLAWRCVLMYGYGAPYFDRIYMGTDTRADSILWGCVMALVANPFLDRSRIPDRVWAWVGLPVGLVVLYSVHAAGGNRPSFALTIQAAAIWLIVAAVIRNPEWGPIRVLNWRPVAFIGVLSYSLYLVHRWFIQWTDERIVNPWIGFAVAAVVSIGVAWLFHVGLEKPFTRLRKRFSEVRPVVADADDPVLARTRVLT
ncbi:acyltransferase [Nocardioides sp. GY 10113]|uniref:acyltransferase family protein n=1 Tax=Nocardioides sp. GY 10113 TaxID=2569761 RepID=UPI0010A890AD|nr:acyltransferase [Nocardioides sp. GY 10113]TIC88389.1 acyltransferase [Nocardioides sp. GY 10113]